MTETATVLEVVDGDTVDVRLDDGSEETVRVLGIDTPETSDNVEAERRAEWEGVEDLDYLGRWGDRASEFAKAELGDADVELEADENEPDRGSYGRLLRYVRYSSDDAAETVVYNRRAVVEGYARVYDSGFTDHDEYLQAEIAARSEGRHVWTRSDPASTPERRDDPVQRVYVPRTASIHTEGGAVDESRVPVFASETATQERGSESATTYEERIPLVAVDDAARVGFVGGPLVDEQYEEAEGFAEDTSRYGNFPFVTNLLDSVTDRTGPVVVDGGHGQFNADFALSCEDMAYYLRYLEGQDIALRQTNSLTSEALAEARGILVTAPSTPFTDAQLEALAGFRDDGGAVVLLGHGTDGMPADARENLNDVAKALGTDLRLNADRITDDDAHLADDSGLPVTGRFNDAFDLFSPVTPEPSTVGRVRIAEIEPDVDGTDAGYTEAVVVENTSESPLDLSGWHLEDTAGHRFEFPAGTTLPADGAVEVRTGEGTDRVIVTWPRSQDVWNDDGDTVSVISEEGTVVAERSY